MKKSTGKYGYSYATKSIAFFVLCSFTLLNTFNTGFSYAQIIPTGSPTSAVDLSNLPKIIESLVIPENIGTIQERFIPDPANQNNTLIVYVQNAHSNLDSERNTQDLIAHFQKELNLPLVLLEGGEGKLDNLFFKSFPDKELKEKLLNDYLAKGDLSGGETASILFDQHDTQYYGIENQALYDENKKAFLESLEKESEISRRLDVIQQELNQKAKSVLNENSLKFREKSEAFQKEEIDLMDYLKYLSGFYDSSFSNAYSELAKILNAEQNEKRFKNEDVDAATTQLIATFQKKILPKLPRPKQMEINQMIQMHRIGHLGEGMLIGQLEKVAKEMNFFFETPEVLKPAARHAQTISAIKGTQIFEELKKLEQDLRNKLPETEQGRQILNDEHYVQMLRQFSRLEVLPEDWYFIKSQKPSGLLKSSIGSSASEFDALFDPHFKFYQLADERDKVLFKNISNIIKKEKAKVALVSTGGFHVAGITHQLKESNTPFVLIAPKISQFTERSVYLNAMQDKRSFMKYFNGSLWDALAQDYASKLAASLKEEDLSPNLKRWRDRIIQNSIAEGRITEAGSYTKYVDALVQALRKEFEKGSPFDGKNQKPRTEAQIREALQKELNSFLSTYFDKIESLLKQKVQVFGDGLKELWKTKEVTPQSINQLIDRVNAAKTSNLAVQLVLTHLPMQGAESARKVSEILFKDQSTEFHDAVSEIVSNFTPEEISRLKAQHRVTGLKDAVRFSQTLKEHNVPDEEIEALFSEVDKAFAEKAAVDASSTKISSPVMTSQVESEASAAARLETRTLQQPSSDWIEKNVPVTSKNGVHLTIASSLIQIHKKFEPNTELKLFARGNQLNLNSILDLTTHGILAGEVINIKAKGPRANDAIKDIEKVLGGEIPDGLPPVKFDRFNEEDMILATAKAMEEADAAKKSARAETRIQDEFNVIKSVAPLLGQFDPASDDHNVRRKFQNALSQANVSLEKILESHPLTHREAVIRFSDFSVGNIVFDSQIQEGRESYLFVSEVQDNFVLLVNRDGDRVPHGEFGSPLVKGRYQKITPRAETRAKRVKIDKLIRDQVIEQITREVVKQIAPPAIKQGDFKVQYRDQEDKILVQVHGQYWLGPPDIKTFGEEDDSKSSMRTVLELDLVKSYGVNAKVASGTPDLDGAVKKQAKEKLSYSNKSEEQVLKDLKQIEKRIKFYDRKPSRSIVKAVLELRQIARRVQMIQDWTSNDQEKQSEFGLTRLLSLARILQNKFSARAETRSVDVDFITTRDWAKEGKGAKILQNLLSVQNETRLPVVFEKGLLTIQIDGEKESAVTKPNDPFFGQLYDQLGEGISAGTKERLENQSMSPMIRLGMYLAVGVGTVLIVAIINLFLGVPIAVRFPQLLNPVAKIILGGIATSLAISIAALMTYSLTLWWRGLKSTKRRAVEKILRQKMNDIRQLKTESNIGRAETRLLVRVGVAAFVGFFYRLLKSRSHSKLEIEDLIGNKEVYRSFVTQQPFKVRRTFSVLRPYIGFKDLKNVLIIGATVPELKTLFRNVGLETQVTAIDIDLGQLEKLKKHFQGKSDFARRLHLYHADASGLDKRVFPDGVFDFIYAVSLDRSAFLNKERGDQVLAEIAEEEFRILKPDGIIFHSISMTDIGVSDGFRRKHIDDRELLTLGPPGLYKKDFGRAETRNVKTAFISFAILGIAALGYQWHNNSSISPVVTVSQASSSAPIKSSSIGLINTDKYKYVALAIQEAEKDNVKLDLEFFGDQLKSSDPIIRSLIFKFIRQRKIPITLSFLNRFNETIVGSRSQNSGPKFEAIYGVKTVYDLNIAQLIDLKSRMISEIDYVFAVELYNRIHEDAARRGIKLSDEYDDLNLILLRFLGDYKDKLNTLSVEEQKEFALDALEVLISIREKKADEIILEPGSSVVIVSYPDFAEDLEKLEEILKQIGVNDIIVFEGKPGRADKIKSEEVKQNYLEYLTQISRQGKRVVNYWNTHGWPDRIRLAKDVDITFEEMTAAIIEGQKQRSASSEKFSLNMPIITNACFGACVSYIPDRLNRMSKGGEINMPTIAATDYSTVGATPVFLPNLKKVVDAKSAKKPSEPIKLSYRDFYEVDRLGQPIMRGDEIWPAYFHQNGVIRVPVNAKDLKSFREKWKLTDTFSNIPIQISMLKPLSFADVRAETRSDSLIAWLAETGNSWTRQDGTVMKIKKVDSREFGVFLQDDTNPVLLFEFETDKGEIHQFTTDLPDVKPTPGLAKSVFQLLAADVAQRNMKLTLTSVINPKMISLLQKVGTDVEVQFKFDAFDVANPQQQLSQAGNILGAVSERTLSVSDMWNHNSEETVLSREPDGSFKLSKTRFQDGTDNALSLEMTPEGTISIHRDHPIGYVSPERRSLYSPNWAGDAPGEHVLYWLPVNSLAHFRDINPFIGRRSYKIVENSIPFQGTIGPIFDVIRVGDRLELKKDGVQTNEENKTLNFTSTLEGETNHYVVSIDRETGFISVQENGKPTTKQVIYETEWLDYRATPVPNQAVAQTNQALANEFQKETKAKAASQAVTPQLQPISVPVPPKPAPVTAKKAPMKIVGSADQLEKSLNELETEVRELSKGKRIGTLDIRSRGDLSVHYSVAEGSEVASWVRERVKVFREQEIGIRGVDETFPMGIDLVGTTLRLTPNAKRAETREAGGQTFQDPDGPLAISVNISESLLQFSFTRFGENHLITKLFDYIWLYMAQQFYDGELTEAELTDLMIKQKKSLDNVRPGLEKAVQNDDAMKIMVDDFYFAMEKLYSSYRLSSRAETRTANSGRIANIWSFVRKLSKLNFAAPVIGLLWEILRIGFGTRTKVKVRDEKILLEYQHFPGQGAYRFRVGDTLFLDLSAFRFQSTKKPAGVKNIINMANIHPLHYDPSTTQGAILGLQLTRDLIRNRKVIDFGASTGILGLSVIPDHPSEVIFIEELAEWKHPVIRQNAEQNNLTNYQILTGHEDNFSDLMNKNVDDAVVVTNPGYNSGFPILRDSILKNGKPAVIIASGGFAPDAEGIEGLLGHEEWNFEKINIGVFSTLIAVRKDAKPKASIDVAKPLSLSRAEARAKKQPDPLTEAIKNQPGQMIVVGLNHVLGNRLGAISSYLGVLKRTEQPQRRKEAATEIFTLIRRIHETLESFSEGNLVAVIYSPDATPIYAFIDKANRADFDQTRSLSENEHNLLLGLKISGPINDIQNQITLFEQSLGSQKQILNLTPTELNERIKNIPNFKAQFSQIENLGSTGRAETRNQQEEIMNITNKFESNANIASVQRILNEKGSLDQIPFNELPDLLSTLISLGALRQRLQNIFPDNWQKLEIGRKIQTLHAAAYSRHRELIGTPEAVSASALRSLKVNRGIKLEQLRQKQENAHRWVEALNSLTKEFSTEEIQQAFDQLDLEGDKNWRTDLQELLVHYAQMHEQEELRKTQLENILVQMAAIEERKALDVIQQFDELKKLQPEFENLTSSSLALYDKLHKLLEKDSQFLEKLIDAAKRNRGQDRAEARTDQSNVKQLFTAFYEQLNQLLPARAEVRQLLEHPFAGTIIMAVMSGILGLIAVFTRVLANFSDQARAQKEDKETKDFLEEHQRAIRLRAFFDSPRDPRQIANGMMRNISRLIELWRQNNQESQTLEKIELLKTRIENTLKSISDISLELMGLSDSLMKSIQEEQILLEPKEQRRLNRSALKARRAMKILLANEKWVRTLIKNKDSRKLDGVLEYLNDRFDEATKYFQSANLIIPSLDSGRAETREISQEELISFIIEAGGLYEDLSEYWRPTKGSTHSGLQDLEYIQYLAEQYRDGELSWNKFSEMLRRSDFKNYRAKLEELYGTNGPFTEHHETLKDFLRILDQIQFATSRAEVRMDVLAPLPQLESDIDKTHIPSSLLESAQKTGYSLEIRIPRKETMGQISEKALGAMPAEDLTELISRPSSDQYLFDLDKAGNLYIRLTSADLPRRWVWSLPKTNMKRGNGLLVMDPRIYQANQSQIQLIRKTIMDYQAEEDPLLKAQSAEKIEELRKRLSSLDGRLFFVTYENIDGHDGFLIQRVMLADPQVIFELNFVHRAEARSYDDLIGLVIYDSELFAKENLRMTEAFKGELENLIEAATSGKNGLTTEVSDLIGVFIQHTEDIAQQVEESKNIGRGEQILVLAVEDLVSQLDSYQKPLDRFLKKQPDTYRLVQKFWNAARSESRTDSPITSERPEARAEMRGKQQTNQPESMRQAAQLEAGILNILSVFKKLNRSKEDVDAALGRLRSLVLSQDHKFFELLNNPNVYLAFPDTDLVAEGKKVGLTRPDIMIIKIQNEEEGPTIQITPVDIKASLSSAVPKQIEWNFGVEGKSWNLNDIFRNGFELIELRPIEGTDSRQRLLEAYMRNILEEAVHAIGQKPVQVKGQDGFYIVPLDEKQARDSNFRLSKGNHFLLKPNALELIQGFSVEKRAESRNQRKLPADIILPAGVQATILNSQAAKKHLDQLIRQVQAQGNQNVLVHTTIPGQAQDNATVLFLNLNPIEVAWLMKRKKIDAIKLVYPNGEQTILYGSDLSEEKRFRLILKLPERKSIMGMNLMLFYARLAVNSKRVDVLEKLAKLAELNGKPNFADNLRGFIKEIHWSNQPNLDPRIFGFGKQQIRIGLDNGEIVIIDIHDESVIAKKPAPVTIGRDGNQNDVQLSDENVSRRHAFIEKRGEDYYLVDAGAINGIFVDGTKMDQNEIQLEFNQPTQQSQLEPRAEARIERTPERLLQLFFGTSGSDFNRFAQEIQEHFRNSPEFRQEFDKLLRAILVEDRDALERFNQHQIRPDLGLDTHALIILGQLIQVLQLPGEKTIKDSFGSRTYLPLFRDLLKKKAQREKKDRMEIADSDAQKNVGENILKIFKTAEDMGLRFEVVGGVARVFSIAAILGPEEAQGLGLSDVDGRLIHPNLLTQPVAESLKLEFSKKLSISYHEMNPILYESFREKSVDLSFNAIKVVKTKNGYLLSGPKGVFQDIRERRLRLIIPQEFNWKEIDQPDTNYIYMARILPFIVLFRLMGFTIQDAETSEFIDKLFASWRTFTDNQKHRLATEVLDAIMRRMPDLVEIKDFMESINALDFFDGTLQKRYLESEGLWKKDVRAESRGDLDVIEFGIRPGFTIDDVANKYLTDPKIDHFKIRNKAYSLEEARQAFGNQPISRDQWITLRVYYPRSEVRTNVPEAKMDEFERELGISKSDLAQAIVKHPPLAGYSVLDNLKPKLVILRSLGVEKSEELNALLGIATFSIKILNLMVQISNEENLLIRNRKDIGRLYRNLNRNVKKDTGFTAGILIRKNPDALEQTVKPILKNLMIQSLPTRAEVRISDVANKLSGHLLGREKINPGDFAIQVRAVVSDEVKIQEFQTLVLNRTVDQLGKERGPVTEKIQAELLDLRSKGTANAGLVQEAVQRAMKSSGLFSEAILKTPFEDKEIHNSLDKIAELLNQKPQAAEAVISKEAADLAKAIFNAIVQIDRVTVIEHRITKEEFESIAPEKRAGIITEITETAADAVGTNKFIIVRLVLPSREAVRLTNIPLPHNGKVRRLQPGLTVTLGNAENSEFLKQMDSRAVIGVGTDLDRVSSERTLFTNRYADGKPVNLNEESIAAGFLAAGLAYVALSEKTANALVPLNDGNLQARSDEHIRALTALVRLMLESSRRQALAAQAA